MRVLDNILTSGHVFSENDNLLKFRFAILNVFIVVPSFTTLIHLLASFTGIAEFGNTFEIAIFSNLMVLLFLIYFLRKDKKHYIVVVSLYIFATLTLFYFVILTRVEDEFRLICLFLLLFATYVLLGKNAGMSLALLILASILLISNSYELELSSFAYSSFYTFFIVFAVMLYYFFKKMERDAFEFEVLNNQLKEKVRQETNQRMEQEQMLLRRSRMANMGEMLDSIAHQWRQPLMHINSILLNMDSVLDIKSKNDNDKEYLQCKVDEVAVLTTHMSQTIEDFRGLFKVERAYTKFILQDVINEVLALLKNNLNNIVLECRGEGDVMVLGHRSELMQVIIIVLSNSIEVLNTRKVQGKNIIIDIESFDSRACISIEDNAGGISANNADRIFDPYFTTKEQSGGTGLGLYIAKIIVEHNMGGGITVSNTAGGAKFSILLEKQPSKEASIDT